MSKENKSTVQNLCPFFISDLYQNQEPDFFEKRALEELDTLERQLATVLRLAGSNINEAVVNSTKGVSFETSLKACDLLNLTESVLSYIVETRLIVKGDVK